MSVQRTVTNMNLIVTFHYVVFFVICFGTAKAATPSGDKIAENLNVPHEMCQSPIFTFQYDTMVFYKVKKIGEICQETAMSNLTRFRNSTTIEGFRELFSLFCERQSTIRDCWAETTTKLQTCQDEPVLKTFKVYREVMDHILFDIGCSENGDKLAILVHGLVNWWAEKTKVARNLDKCTDRYGVMFDDLNNAEVDISSKLFLLYNEIKTFEECFNENQELPDSLRDVVKSFLEPIINTMKCVDPQGGELVLCGTIDAGSVATLNVCDLRTVGTNVSLYDALEEKTGSCIMNLFRHYESNVVEDDGIQNSLLHECGHRMHCYNQSKIVSELCLNETEQTQFNLLGDFIKSAYHTACADGDKRLADILIEVFRRQIPDQDHLLWVCVDVALSTRNVTDEHRNSSKNVRLYHEVEAFKECLVNKLQGHQTSVDAATSLIGDLLKKVKCVYPEDGTAVLCETLHHTA